MNKLNLVLRKARMSQAITQSEMARMLGCTPAFIAQIEQGIAYPTLNYIKLASKVLNLNYKYIMRLYEVNKPLTGGSSHREPTTYLGKLLRAYREEMDMNASELARLLDVSQQAITAYEIGKTGMAEVVLQKFSQLSNIPVEYLRAGSSLNTAKMRRIDLKYLRRII